MGHDGCPEHGHGGVDAVMKISRGGTVERRHQRVDGRQLPVGVDEKYLECVGDADDRDEGHDAAFQPAKAGEIEREDGEDQDAGDQCRDEQGFPGADAVRVEQRTEEEVETDRGAEEFGEIGGDGGDLGCDPEADGGGAGEMFAAVLRQRETGDDAELGRKILDQHGHRVRPKQHPEQAVAELRPAKDVGGEVAGVDVCDGGDECRAEVGPHLVAMEFGLEAAAAIGIFGRCSGRLGEHRLSGGDLLQRQCRPVGHSLLCRVSLRCIGSG
jgi:hypothetical protein